MTSLSYVEITGTFEDGQGNPLSGYVTLTPSQPVYAAGIPLLTPAVPVTATISGGTLAATRLLATDNSGLSYGTQTGWFCWDVTVTLGGEELPGWSFFLPYDSLGAGPVDLYSLASTSAGGGGGGGAVDSVFGRAGAVAAETGDYTVSQVTGAASTAYVATAVAPLAPLASPALTGNPTAPTQSTGDSTAKIATDAFVAAAIAAIGLGSAATMAADAFDAAGAAADALAEAEAYALRSAGGTMSGYLAPAVVMLASGTSIAVDAAEGNVFTLTLTASTGTIANPANPADGQIIRVRLTQDDTGGRTVAWGSAYDWGSTGGAANTAPVLTATPGATDFIGFEYSAATGKWCYLSAPFPQGY